MLQVMQMIKNRILGRGSRSLAFPQSDRYSTYPSNGLTPEKMARILRTADAGDVSELMELYEEMEEKDPHLFSLLQTRKNAVLGLDYEILPFSDDPEDIRTMEAVSSVFYGIENIEDMIFDLLDAIGKGFAICEIQWKRKDAKTYVERINRIHPKRIVFDDDDRILISTIDSPMGEMVSKDRLMVHHYRARSAHMSRSGVLRTIAWVYLFKNYALKDWVVYTEGYGMPMRIGKYSPSASPSDIATLEKAVANLGSALGITIPESTQIELKEAMRGGNATVYENLLKFCNAEMSKAILGQTLTTEMGSSGSFAASQTHNSVRQDLLEADCKSLSSTIGKCLFRPIVLNAFPGDDRRLSQLPYIRFHVSPPEDLTAEADMYVKLAKDIGLPIPHEHLYERFGIPKPEKGQPVTRTQGFALKDTETKELTTMVLSDKASDVQTYQRAIDDMVSAAVKEVLPEHEAAFRHIISAAEGTEDMEALIEKLNHDETCIQLLQDMRSERVVELLSKAMLIADLLGRMRDDD